MKTSTVNYGKAKGFFKYFTSLFIQTENNFVTQRKKEKFLNAKNFYADIMWITMGITMGITCG